MRYSFDETLVIGADSDWFVRLTQLDARLDVLPTLVLRKGVLAPQVFLLTLRPIGVNYRRWRVGFFISGAKANHERA